MKKELAPSAHQKKIELAPFAPKKKSQLAPLRDRKAKIARCGAPRKTSGAGLVALRPRGLGQILPRKALKPPSASLRRHLRSKLGLRPRSGAAGLKSFVDLGMVLPEKNLSSPPPQKKRKALGLALSVKKNSGLARAKKKSSPLLKSKIVVLA